MDCSTCRSLFSQSFDERLAGERRQAFVLHLQACQPCDSEFTLYRRVFSTIRDLPDGEALPFQAPAEVPGALTQFQASSAPPRFARIAASILILVGLVGTHVLVFQWSRDHASRGTDNGGKAVAPPVVAPVLTNAASMNSVLPSALRDHVDAADLLMRTLDKLPDDPSARDVAAADWAVSRLPELTEELRRQQFESPPEIRWLVKQYLDEAENQFVPRMQSAIQNGQSVREIRNAASFSNLCRLLGPMKLVVAALPRGTSFGCQPAPTVFSRLALDGRRLISAKHARLSGQYSRAIEDVKLFDDEFPKSRLRPAAIYVGFDAYNSAGMPGEAWSFVGRSGCVQLSGPPQMVIRELGRFVASPMTNPTWEMKPWEPHQQQVLGLTFRWTSPVPAPQAQGLDDAPELRPAPK